MNLVFQKQNVVLPNFLKIFLFFVYLPFLFRPRERALYSRGYRGRANYYTPY